MRGILCYVAVSCVFFLLVNFLHGLLVEYHSSYIRVAWKSYHFVINILNHSVSLTLFPEIAMCKSRIVFCLPAKWDVSSAGIASPLVLCARTCCNTEALSRNHCYRGKAVSITCYECVSAVFAIQNTKRMRRIILSSVAGLGLPHFSALSYKRHDFRGKKNVLNANCVF